MPTSSDAAQDKKIVDAYFPASSRTETVILVPADGDMLSVSNFNLMLSAYTDLAAAQATYNGELLSWGSMCTMSGGYCNTQNALEPFNYTVPSTRAAILTKLNSIPSGTAR